MKSKNKNSIKDKITLTNKKIGGKYSKLPLAHQIKTTLHTVAIPGPLRPDSTAPRLVS